MTLRPPLPPPDLHLDTRGCEADGLFDGALSAEPGAVRPAGPSRGSRSASASGSAPRLAVGAGDDAVGLR